MRPLDGELDETRVYSYNASWQLLEERVDATHTDIPDRRVQHVWGTRYIDDPVLNRRDFNNDGDYADTGEEAYYHLTDAMFSTVALITSSSASVVERMAYDAYGTAQQMRNGDITGDGAVDGADLGALLGFGYHSIGNASYSASGDLNRDGEVDSGDLGQLLGDWSEALAPGSLSFKDNDIGFDGYIFDHETQMYTARNRTLHPVLGRWIERDPLGIGGGANSCEYVGDDPIASADPSGLDPPAGSPRPKPTPPPESTPPRVTPPPGQTPTTPAAPPAASPELIEIHCPDDGDGEVVQGGGNKGQVVGPILRALGSTNDQKVAGQVTRGCIGVCALACGITDSRDRRPEQLPDTHCFLEQKKAEEFPCPDGKKRVVWAKQGPSWKGGKQPQPGEGGAIPPDSVDPQGPNGSYNYVVVVVDGKKKCYVYMNHGTQDDHADKPLQLYRTKDVPSDPEHLPAMMWCATCK